MYRDTRSLEALSLAVKKYKLGNPRIVCALSYPMYFYAMGYDSLVLTVSHLFAV